MGTVVVRQAVVFSLLCLLFVSFASAYTVNKAWVDWQGNEVKTISPTHALSDATLKLNITPDFKDCFDPAKYQSKTCTIYVIAANIGADASSKDLLRQYQLGVRSDCVKNDDDTYTCTTPSFAFGTTVAANPIKYFTMIDTAKSSTQTVNIPITLDTTTPKVTSIKTNYCVGTTCYFAGNVPTKVTIQFDDTLTSYDFQLVAFGSIDSQQTQAFVSSCTGKTCVGDLTIPCGADGEQHQLQVRDLSSGVPTTEDAQNAVTLGTPQTIVCSLASPTILDWQGPVSDGPYGLIVSGGSITYTAKVQSSAGTVSGFVNVSDMTDSTTAGNANCVQSDSTDNSLFTCTWQIPSLKPGTYTLNFIMQDQVGNIVTHTDPSRKVLNLTTPSTGQRVDYFTIAKKDVMPDRINRLAIDLARSNFLPYPLYVTYNLNRKTAGVSVLHQSLKSCWYKFPNDPNATNYTTTLALFSVDQTESRVLYPSQDFDQLNRLNLQIRAPNDVLKKADAFDVKCQIDLSVANGDKIYSVPDSVNLSFQVKLRESPLGQPGAAFVQKINRTQQDISTGSGATIQKIEKLREKLDSVCQVGNVLSELQGIDSILTSLGSAMCLNPYTNAAGQVLHQGSILASIPIVGSVSSLWKGEASSTGGTASVTANKIQAYTLILASNNALVGGGGVLKKICQQINCRMVPDINSGGSGGSGGDAGAAPVTTSSIGNDLAKYGQSRLLSNLNVADPSASIVGAVSTMCLGGVVYNLDKNLAVDCNYLICLKNQAAQGGSVAVCDDARGFNKCMQVMGEISELPLVRVVKNFLSNFNNILKNLPVLLVRFAIDETCANKWGTVVKSSETCGDVYGAVCGLVQSALSITDSMTASATALGGIPSGAGPMATKTCDSAIQSTPTALQQQASQSIMDFMARTGAARQDALARGSGAGPSTFDSPVLWAYAAVGGIKTKTATSGKITTTTIPCFSPGESIGSCTPVIISPNTDGTTSVTVGTGDKAVTSTFAMSAATMNKQFGFTDPSSPAYNARSQYLMDNAVLAEAQGAQKASASGTLSPDAAKGELEAAQKLLADTQSNPRPEGMTQAEYDAAIQRLQFAVTNAQVDVAKADVAVSNPPLTDQQQAALDAAVYAATHAPQGGTYEDSAKYRDAIMLAQYPNLDAAQQAALLEVQHSLDYTTRNRPPEWTDKEYADTLQRLHDSVVVAENPALAKAITDLASATDDQTKAVTQMSDTVKKDVDALTPFKATDPQVQFELDKGALTAATANLKAAQDNLKLYESGGQPEGMTGDEYDAGLKTLQDGVKAAQGNVETLTTTVNAETTATTDNYQARQYVQSQYGFTTDPVTGKVTLPEGSGATLSLTPKQIMDSNLEKTTSDFAGTLPKGAPQDTFNANAMLARDALACQAAGTCNLRDSTDPMSKRLKDAKLTPDCQAGTECQIGFGTDGKGTNGCVTGGMCMSQHDVLVDNAKGTKAINELASFIGSYVGKWLLDKGVFTQMQLGGFLGDFANRVDPTQIETSLCSNKYDISDNDNGAVYFNSGTQSLAPVATFGSESMNIANETDNMTAYITVVYINNPQQDGKHNNSVEIFLQDLKGCSEGSCPSEISLNNGVQYNLNEGQVFGNGNSPKTRIDYLPGVYNRICLRFDKNFPNDNGKNTYCRTISDEVFNTGTSVPPAGTVASGTSGAGSPGGTGGAGTPSADPLGGWK